MAFLGTLGLAHGYFLTRPRFDSKGMIFKPLCYSCASDSDLLPYKKYVFVDLVIGADVVQFVPYDANDILGRFSNPFHILYGAVVNVRRRKQWLSAISAWSNVFPENPGSGFSCVNMFSRAVLPALIYRDDDTVYDVPRGLRSPRILLGLSPTAINSLLDQARQLGASVRDAGGPVFYLEPRRARAVGNTMMMSSYVVTPVENPNPGLVPEIHKLLDEFFDFSEVLKPLSLDEQLELLAYSAVPKSAVVYALTDTDLITRLPARYVEAGKEELRALQQAVPSYTGHPAVPPAASPAAPPAPQQAGLGLPPQQFHPETGQYKQASEPPQPTYGGFSPQVHQHDSPVSSNPPAPPVLPNIPVQPAPQMPQPPQNPAVMPGPVPEEHAKPSGDLSSEQSQAIRNDIPELPKTISDLVRQLRGNG